MTDKPNAHAHARADVGTVHSPRGLRALSEFFRLEAAGGIMLIAAAALAMLAANSPLAAAYDAFRDIPVQIRIGELEIAKPLLLWINDGLMAVFFLLVALEIKRESLSGQLASREQLILPMVCACAGVAVPALLFTAFNHGNAYAMRGWAVPTATDIAFALGVLALLGSRVPSGMKLLLSTIAVVDDLIAIVMIALFYSYGLSMVALAWAGAAIAGMFLLNRLRVRRLAPYLLLGVVLWVCVLKSGVHATLAGVVTGLMIPHVDRKNSVDDEVEHSPLESLEHALHPWVAYAILPLFAFVNAGLVLGRLSMDDVLSPLTIGMVIGLFIGKPVGIVGAALLMRSLGWARFPEGMGVRAMVGLGVMCGIGFTMSLFIASLAYLDPLFYEEAVLGVLVASLVSALVGYGWLRMTLPVRAKAGG
ncbi:MAG TPA: Na+/H+ antiporter NhaA [Lysobacter sp.]